ncbi:MAG: class I SAM-dependent methyltransferase [Anaerolineae bacterium]|nr:class I SAM-dependent methyltransferase [Anaerolineae bacterium]
MSIFHRNWLERREHLRLIAAAAKAHATGLTLDVGCGNRPYEALLAPHVKGIIGLDLPPDQDIERRPGTAAQRSQAVDVYGDAMQLPFADESFDTVVSFQVLEHVPEPQRMMGEISRVLRAGGHLILSTPQMWHVHEAPHDYYRFTRFGLAYLCRAGGLEIIAVQAIAGFWARAGLKLTYGLDRIGRGLGRISRLLSAVTLPFIAAVNLAFKLLDMLLANEDDCVINFLVARKPQP